MSPGADYSLLERFDNFAGLRNGLRRVAEARDDWAGIPMPIDGQPLVIHPKFPRGAELAKIGAPESKPWPDGVSHRASFWCSARRLTVHIWNDPDGKVRGGPEPGSGNRLGMELSTMGASYAWGIEQESRALNLLGTMLPHHLFKMYLLTGMFIETSKRSGLSYVFRKLRPTIVVDAREGVQGRPRYSIGDIKSAPPSTGCRFVTALCMHAIGYYEGSWAGAMCPTDDVIAHLSMMRADEPMFWRRANQIPVDRPNAGV